MAIARSSYYHSSRRHHYAQTHGHHPQTHHKKTDFRNAVQKVLDSNIPWTIYTSAVVPQGATFKMAQSAAGNDMYFGFDIGTSAQWASILKCFNNNVTLASGAIQKYEISEYRARVRITSTCVTPAELSCYEIVPRMGNSANAIAEIYSALVTMLSSSVQYQIPNNVTFYMLPLFTTQFKIIRRTVYKLQPGECKTLHFKIPGILPRVVNSLYGQESNYDRYQGRSMIFRFSGEPIHDATTSTLVNLSLPTVDSVADYIAKGRAVNAGSTAAQDTCTITNVASLGTITSQATVSDEYGQKVSGNQL
nr:MAG: capsid protein [Cressdnaviricota sp.]